MNPGMNDTAVIPPLVPGEIHLWTREGDAPDDAAILKLLLSGYLKTEPAQVRVGIRPKGKPFVENDPTLFFNLSHSRGILVLAFSRDGELGVDIEMIRDLPDLDLLIDRNLTSREKEYTLKDPKKKLTRFFQLWTLKESYLKATGDGMRLSPENLEFTVEGGNIRLNSLSFGHDTSQWRFRTFTRGHDFTGTLAYRGSNTVIREMEWDHIAG
jgi:4'-phosphopantetheinyl transferase